MTDFIECSNQNDLNGLIREHGENLRVRIVGNWPSLEIASDQTVGDITVGGTANVGGIRVGGTVTGKMQLYDTVLNGPTWIEEFAAGPMIELFAACPGGIEKARDGWGNRDWTSCPLHEALGAGSFADCDRLLPTPKLRLFARLFVFLHDAGKIKRPEVAL